MKIISLHAENIKRIKAIDITPTDNVIVISGKNEEGKTSSIDSIWLALQYRAASKGNPNPLRAGTNKGEIILDLNDYIVTRKFSSSGGTTLEVKTPDGSKISSPQTLLDGLVGDLSFDPWEFARKNEKDQKQMIADLLYNTTGGKTDLGAFDRKYQELYDQRSDINKERKRLISLLTSIAPPTQNDPIEEISIADITQSITSAIEVSAYIRNLLEREGQINERLFELQNEINTLQKEKEIISDSLSKIPEIPDIDFLKSELINLENINKRAREVKEFNTIKNSLEKIDAEIKTINNKMELIDIERAEALENSSLPINNVRIMPDGIMIINEEEQLVPFCQASAAQKLRISLSLAMAANPKLRVIRIADGSLLDDNSIQIIKDMAKDKDFQIWIEYMSRNDQDRIGIYIQDGQIA